MSLKPAAMTGQQLPLPILQNTCHDFSKEDPPSPRAPPPSPRQHCNLTTPLEEDPEFLELTNLSTDLNEFSRWQDLDKDFAELFVNDSLRAQEQTHETEDLDFYDLPPPMYDLDCPVGKDIWNMDFDDLWSSASVDTPRSEIPYIETPLNLCNTFDLDIFSDMPTPSSISSPASCTSYPYNSSNNNLMPPATSIASPSCLKMTMSLPSNKRSRSFDDDEDEEAEFTHAFESSFPSCKRQRFQQTPLIVDCELLDSTWLETMDGLNPVMSLENFDFTELFRLDVPTHS